MENSILRSVKKNLGLDPDDDAFDTDVITHINSVFTDLNQLGPGPIEGFMIEDDSAVWDDFMGSSPLMNNVKTYMYLSVRLVWDPPPTSFAINALEEQRREKAWRITVEYDRKNWADPNPSVGTGMVLDGGAP